MAEVLGSDLDLHDRLSRLSSRQVRARAGLGVIVSRLLGRGRAADIWTGRGGSLA